jgi:hypothetical protein
LQAIQQELFDYRHSLEFKYEHPLNSQPLRIDLLIIKKPKNLTIDKNIARIFRSENLLEYKSPTDYLSVNDYLKGYALAHLYTAITPGVDLADLTLTFVESRHPRKLLRYLSGPRGYKVEESSPGIYLVTGDYVPIQIIESKKLPEQENLWLTSLSKKGLKTGGTGSIIDEARKYGDEAQLDAYLDVLFRINPKAFLEAEKMARKRGETLEEVFTKGGLIPEWLERGRVQGLEQGREDIARNAVVKGLPLEVIRDITGLDIERIKRLQYNDK